MDFLLKSELEILEGKGENAGNDKFWWKFSSPPTCIGSTCPPA